MDIRQLQYFRDIVAAGSFNGAANRIRISQSALSRQIQQLEWELGVALFERHARGVHLTESGRLLSDRVELLMRQISNMKNEIVERSRVPTGELHIGIPRSMRTLLTRPSIERFRSAHPQVFIRYVEDSSALVRDKLLHGDLDLGLLSTHEPATVLESRPLLSEQMFFVGPSSAGLTLDRPVELADVLGMPLITTSPPASLRVALDKAAAGMGRSFTAIAEINSSLMLEFVADGQGYSVYSYCGIYDHIRAGRISAAPIRGFSIEWVLATSRERPLSVANSVFQDILRDVADLQISSGAWHSGRLSQAT